MRCQKPVSYMDRNMTRWGIQLLDICSVLTQKGSQARRTASSAGWPGRQSRAPPAGRSIQGEEEVPAGPDGKEAPYSAISQLETDHRFHLAVVQD